MVVVVIVALNCLALRAILDQRKPIETFVSAGCLPMANILGAGLLLGIRYPGSRRFIIGFEIIGALSLTSLAWGILNLIGAISGKPPLLLDWIVVALINPAFDRWPDVGPMPETILPILREWVYLSTKATLPQLAIAIAAGVLTARFPRLPSSRLRSRRGAANDGRRDRHQTDRVR
jgi:hypothetical protein